MEIEYVITALTFLVVFFAIWVLGETLWVSRKEKRKAAE